MRVKHMRNGQPINTSPSKAINIFFNKVGRKLITRGNVQGALEELDDAVDGLNSNLSKKANVSYIGKTVASQNSVLNYTATEDCMIELLINGNQTYTETDIKINSINVHVPTTSHFYLKKGDTVTSTTSFRIANIIK